MVQTRNILYNEHAMFENPSARKKNKPVDHTRRQFLGALTASALAGGSYALPKMVRDFFTDVDPEKVPRPSEQYPTHSAAESTGTALPTPEQIVIEERNEDVVVQTLEEQIEKNGSVRLNEATMRAVTQKWETLYGRNGNLHTGLLQGLKRMRPWLPAIQDVFRKNDVPEEYLYLAIPESHFSISARSRLKATGPYQFMEETAKKPPSDLIVTPTFDERYDPIKSAEACAKLLKDNYVKLNNDWDLAISAYNGSQVWKYARNVPAKKRSYAGFLSYMEQQLNAIIARSGTHTVRHGENLHKIAKRYDVTLAAIMKENGMRDTRVRANDRLVIPSSPSGRKKLVAQELDGSVENINYPAKFYAVLSVMKDENLFPHTDELSRGNFSYEQVSSVGNGRAEHVVARKDTLFSIARQYYQKNIGDAVEEIRRSNRLTPKSTITPGMRLAIPRNTERVSLRAIAQQKKIPLRQLLTLNPSVRNENAPLPEQARVRTAAPYGVTMAATENQ